MNPGEKDVRVTVGDAYQIVMLFLNRKVAKYYGKAKT